MGKERLLITGATGNVGRAILKHIDTGRFEVFAGVRDVEKARRRLGRDDIGFLTFDFENGTGFDKLAGFSGIFLLQHFLPRFEKPPAISSDFFRIMRELPRSIDDFLRANGSLFRDL
jgi:uncharacterized protein YbjT (DUF2867 family)